MNSEVKAKWIAALRSGEYQQGRLALRINNAYCCLGVLCDLYDKEHNTDHWEPPMEDNGSYLMGGEPCVPPAFVWHDWAQMDNPNPVDIPTDGINEPSRLSSLAEINDAGASFEQIANLIEKHL
jgi:hypothetical protein